MSNKLIKKIDRYGRRIFFISIVFNVFESIYFGWNEVPMSEAEEICDIISKWGINIGMILTLIPLIVLYRRYLDNLE